MQEALKEENKFWYNSTKEKKILLHFFGYVTFVCEYT
jgi:hypothetical protein